MDNRYYEYGCPPLMNDGRFLTSYVRSSIFDQNIKNINELKSSHEFRHFLQENGSNILNNIKAYLRETNTCKVEGKCLPKKKVELPEDSISVLPNIKENIQENNNEEKCKFCN